MTNALGWTKCGGKANADWKCKKCGSEMGLESKCRMIVEPHWVGNPFDAMREGQQEVLD